MADTPVQIIGQLSLDLKKASKQLKEFAQASTTRLDVVNDKQAIAKLQRVGKEAKKATTFAEKFGEALALKTEQFAVYTVAAAAIGKVSFELAKATREAIRFEQEMIRLSQVFDTSVASTQDLQVAIRKLAVEYGQSANQLARTSVILAQTGLSARETADALEALTRTTLAATFSNIERTTEGAVAIMSQFSIEADDLADKLDVINSVSKKFAVESNDIIEAVKRAGGAFQAAGGDFEQFVALFTSVRSTTRETAETIGTGFRTIFARLQRPKVIDYFKELGIELETVDGAFVGPLKAVQEISQGLDRLGIKPGQTRFAEVVEQLGGLRQVARVIPLLRETAKAQRALDVASDSAGSTVRDAAKAQESLAIRFAQTKQRFEELIFSITKTSSFQALATIFLNVANSLITLADALKEVLPLLIVIQGIRIGASIASKGQGFFTNVSQLAQPPIQLGGRGAIGYAGGGQVINAHGTEYVLTKSKNPQLISGPKSGFMTNVPKNSFIVPIDTPATSKNPGLTKLRTMQAKKAGFNTTGIPGMAIGGYADGTSPSERIFGSLEDNVGAGDLEKAFDGVKRSAHELAEELKEAVREEERAAKKRSDSAKKAAQTRKRNQESLASSEDARLSAKRQQQEKLERSQAINLQRQKDKTLQVERSGEKRLAADRQKQLKEQRESFFQQGTFEGRSGTYGLLSNRQERDPRGRFLGQDVYGVRTPGAQPGAAGPGVYSVSGTTYGLRQPQAVAGPGTYGVGQDVYGIRRPPQPSGPTYALRPDSGTGGLYGPFPQTSAFGIGDAQEQLQSSRRSDSDYARDSRVAAFLRDAGETGGRVRGARQEEDFAREENRRRAQNVRSAAGAARLEQFLASGGADKFDKQLDRISVSAGKAAGTFENFTKIGTLASTAAFALQSTVDPASEAGKNLQSLSNILIQATVTFGILKTASDLLASAKTKELITTLRSNVSGAAGRIGNFFSRKGAGLPNPVGPGGPPPGGGGLPLTGVLSALTVAALVAGEALRRMAESAEKVRDAAIKEGDVEAAGAAGRRAAALRSRSPFKAGAAGAAIGAGIGSVVPIIGTAAGALIGGIAGIIGESTGLFDGLDKEIIEHGETIARSKALFVKLNNDIKDLSKSSKNLKERFGIFRTRGAKSGVISDLIAQAGRTTGGAEQVQLGDAVSRRQEAQEDVDRLQGTGGEELTRAQELLDARKEEEKAIREKVKLEVATIRDALSLAAKNNTLEVAILKLNGDKKLLLDNENRIVRSSIQEGSKLAGAFAELASDMGEQEALHELTKSFLDGSDIINHANRIMGKAFESLTADLETFRFGSIEEKITRLSQANQARQITAAVTSGNLSGIGVGQKGGLEFLKQFLGTGLKIGGQTAEQTLYGEKGLFAQDLRQIFPEASDDEIKQAVTGIAEAANIDQAILEASKEQVDILKAIQKGLGIETEQQTMQREIQEFQARDRAVARQQVARERFARLPDSLQGALTNQFKTGDIDVNRAIQAAARIDAGTRTEIVGDGGYGTMERTVNLPTQEEINELREAFTEFKEGMGGLGLTLKEGAGLIPSEININMQGQPTTNPIRDIQNNAVNQYSSPPPSLPPESNGG